jgi:hypothetical protein
MKRNQSNNLSNAHTTAKVQVDNNVLEKNVSLPRNNRTLSLRDFMSFLKTNLVRDELAYFLKEWNAELSERTSLICEMIPNDVWMIIFRLLAHNKDINVVFPLRQVCKRWENCFPNSLTDATILRPESIKGLLPLNFLRSLTIKAPIELKKEILGDCLTRIDTLALKCTGFITIFNDIWPHLTTLKSLELSHVVKAALESEIPPSINLNLLTNLQTLRIGVTYRYNFAARAVLKELVHLKELDFHAVIDDSLSRATLESRFGVNLELFDSLKKLEVARIPLFKFLNCSELKKKYPLVRLIFYTRDHTYEGDFLDSPDNVFHGKGILSFLHGPNQYRYEGDFRNGLKAGKGICLYRNGSRYEGDYKSNLKEGKGVISYVNGDRYEGDFINDKFEGKGVIYYVNGNRYEGDFINDKLEGKGVVFRASDGCYFEKEYKDGVQICEDILLPHNV